MLVELQDYVPPPSSSSKSFFTGDHGECKSTDSRDTTIKTNGYVNGRKFHSIANAIKSAISPVPPMIHSLLSPLKMPPSSPVAPVSPSDFQSTLLSSPLPDLQCNHSSENCSNDTRNTVNGGRRSNNVQQPLVESPRGRGHLGRFNIRPRPIDIDVPIPVYCQEKDDQFDMKRQESNESCEVCGEGGDLLCCDACPRVFHTGCLDPPLKRIPKGLWICPGQHLIDSSTSINLRSNQHGKWKDEVPIPAYRPVDDYEATVLPNYIRPQCYVITIGK